MLSFEDGFQRKRQTGLPPVLKTWKHYGCFLGPFDKHLPEFLRISNVWLPSGYVKCIKAIAKIDIVNKGKKLLQLNSQCPAYLSHRRFSNILETIYYGILRKTGRNPESWSISMECISINIQINHMPSTKFRAKLAAFIRYVSGSLYNDSLGRNRGVCSI